ncbi:MAG: PrgI family protein [Patescibacteria group bacterium]|nr:PrgI family protein [Patescibacteria group bacterium]
MQFQVPQFIETEDKIVGPFSIRQFIYACAAVGVSALLYFAVGGVVWVIGSIIVFAIAVAFAFVKIEGRPFLDVALAAANFYWKPQIYIWQPEHIRAQRKPRVAELEPVKARPAAVAPARSRESLAAGRSLHTTLATLQTGEKPGKQSDREFLEHKMESRYQIFRRETGDKQAARRVDYR